MYSQYKCTKVNESFEPVLTRAGDTVDEPKDGVVKAGCSTNEIENKHIINNNVLQTFCQLLEVTNKNNVPPPVVVLDGEEAGGKTGAVTAGHSPSATILCWSQCLLIHSCR